MICVKSQASAATPSRRAVLRGAGALAAASLLPAAAVRAEEKYPSAPVQLIVNFPPGGVTDGTFRRISERFQVLTGQPLVIENKAGRGLAPAMLATARPDGYTIGVVGRTQMSLYHQLNGKVAYNPVDDFTWIANITSSWFGLYVRADAPWRTLPDVIAAAKAKPGKLSYGTAFGHGGLSHVPMEEFSRAAGIQMLHVPFKGDADTTLQLLRGEVDMIVAGGSAMAFVDDKRLRLLAWLTPARHPRMPQIPTFHDHGYPIEVVAPVGIGGPKGMQPAHIAALEKIFAALLKDEKVVEFMDRNYQRADFMGSAQFTRWARNQMGVEKQIVAEFNLAEKAK